MSFVHSEDTDFVTCLRKLFVQDQDTFCDRLECLRTALPSFLEEILAPLDEDDREFIVLDVADETVLIWISEIRKYFTASYVIFSDGGVEFTELAKTVFKVENTPTLNEKDSLRDVSINLPTV